MGHINRHRTHGDAPKRPARNGEKNKMDGIKRRKKRKKIEKMLDKRRKKRITQEYGYNSYHVCTSKVFYASRERCGDAMLRVEAVYGAKCWGYHCPLCGGWHITTNGSGTRNEMFCVDDLRGANASV